MTISCTPAEAADLINALRNQPHPLHIDGKEVAANSAYCFSSAKRDTSQPKQVERLPMIVETSDGLYIDGRAVPYVKRNSVSAVTAGDKDQFTEVTLTIIARSYQKK